MFTVGSSRMSKLGLLHERIGEAEALTHPARVLGDSAIGSIAQPDVAQQLGDARFSDSRRKAVELRCIAKVVSPGDVAVEPHIVGEIADAPFHSERSARRIEPVDARLA